MFSNSDEAVINKKLPKELLLRIFSFLDVVTLCRCAQVSRAWNVLALDGSNWQRIDLFDFQRDIEGRVVENISKRCGGFLRKLSLRGCLGVGDNALRTFAQNCRNIEVLNLNGCTKTTDAILEVARCSQLTDVGFTTLARNCHELEKMDLEECVQITDSTLIQLSIHCPRLQVLSLSHCELITDDGIRHLGNGACAHDQLEVIELDNCPLITDASLEHLKSCHSLERIELYDCQQITRAGIKRLRTHLPNIKVHAYFAPVTPPPSVGGSRQRFCRCCIIL
ncbi:F-box/LRR-repeat protein 20 [Cricetulus griseus]|nr:F-box/LRR-repeat protein 20 [Cricetulus griseus]